MTTSHCVTDWQSSCIDIDEFWYRKHIEENKKIILLYNVSINVQVKLVWQIQLKWGHIHRIYCLFGGNKLFVFYLLLFVSHSACFWKGLLRALYFPNIWAYDYNTHIDQVMPVWNVRTGPKIWKFVKFWGGSVRYMSNLVPTIVPRAWKVLPGTLCTLPWQWLDFFGDWDQKIGQAKNSKTIHTKWPLQNVRHLLPWESLSIARMTTPGHKTADPVHMPWCQPNFVFKTIFGVKNVWN